MSLSPQAAAEFVRSRIPGQGLFAGMEWRVAPAPLRLDRKIISELEKLGRVLLQFNRAVNQLYRRSSGGKLPAWPSAYLDRGKPEQILDWQRNEAFRNDLPRVIRPDILLTDDGLKISELDSVPGGIGLTAWLNKTYSELRAQGQNFPEPLGGANGMQNGFASIFPGEAARVHIVISAESSTYAPEMEWLAREIDSSRFAIRDVHFQDFAPGDAIYRFFELFDVRNVPNAPAIFEGAVRNEFSVTPPPKAIFEEKMLFALLCNRNLRDFWRQELGDSFLKKLLQLFPYSWIVDPTPLPPHAAIPQLELTDWQQLKSLSQKERDLILKVSGFSESAWGARGVYLGSDMPAAEWSEAVDQAIASFDSNPFLLQRYHKPGLVEIDWVDFESGKVEKMEGRVRLCPYYFVHGMGDGARAQLCGVLATVCPADKKIIHGMRDAVMAPVAMAE